jgi:hypothetical protein
VGVVLARRIYGACRSPSSCVPCVRTRGVSKPCGWANGCRRWDDAPCTDRGPADEEEQPLLTTPPAARVPRLCRQRLRVVSPSSCPNEPVNVTASSNSFSRSRWIIRPRSSPACRPRSHRLSRILWPSAPGRPASRSVSRSSTSRLRPPCRSKPGPSPPPLGQSLGSGYRGAVPRLPLQGFSEVRLFRTRLPTLKVGSLPSPVLYIYQS